MVALESHRIIDMIPSRESIDVSRWLATFPNIQIVSRDGVYTYSSAATDSHPEAVQVSDRFHLIKGLSEAINKYIIREFPARVEIPLTEAISDEMAALYNTANRALRIRFAHKKRKEGLTVSDIALLLHSSPTTIRKYLAIPEDEIPKDRAVSRERQHQLARQQKQQEVDEARRLAGDGYPIGQIGTMMHHTYKTIQNYLNSDYRVTDGHYNARIPGKLAPYEKDVIELRSQGLTYPQIHTLLCEKGYTGSVASLRMFMQKERSRMREQDEQGNPQSEFIQRKSLCQLIYKKLEDVATITAGQYGQALETYPLLSTLYSLVKEFQTIAARDLLLPMGISFFIFKAISLLVDVYKGTVVLKKNPIYGALYLSFFGQVVSGPICRYNEFYEKADRVGEGKFVWDMFSDGGYLFVKGFIKKVLLANVLSLIVVEIFAIDLEQTSAPLLWLGAVSYSLQLYYDFSGYSDMAIGIGQMYGITCPKNFDYPYITKSISEFWRRWHITLGAWFRDYIYIPLGGSRVASKARLYFNLLIVWILTGIWHGANWTFIFWGLGYFVAIAFEKTFGLPKKLKSKWSRLFYRIAVLASINFQWVIFNSADLLTGLRYIKHMLIGYGYALANARTWILLKEYGIVLVLALVFATPAIPRLIKRIVSKGKKTKSISEVFIGITMVLLFICALSFVIAGQNNPFLYGNF